VVDQNQRPLAAIQVSLHRGKDQILFGRNVRTLADGKFLIEDATEGEWTLQAWPPGESWDEWDRASMEKTVLGGDEQVEMVLTHLDPARATLIAEVVDAESSEPLDPVTVRLRPDGPRKPGEDTASAQPRKQLGLVTIPRVRPGHWTLHVEVAQGWSADLPITVSETDAEVRVRVAVEHPGIISGQVIWEVGARPEFLLVQGDRGVVIDEQGNKAKIIGPLARVGRDGRFRFGEVSPGSSRLQLLGSGKDEPAILGDAEVIVPAHGEVHVELRPIRGGQLRVSGATPQPKCRVELEIAEGDGSFRMRARANSDANGSFACRAYASPGHVRWRLTSRATSERTGGLMDPVVLGEGELDIALGDDVTISLPAAR
jgi:hypothetical protein